MSIIEEIKTKISHMNEADIREIYKYAENQLLYIEAERMLEMYFKAIDAIPCPCGVSEKKLKVYKIPYGYEGDKIISYEEFSYDDSDIDSIAWRYNKAKNSDMFLGEVDAIIWNNVIENYINMCRECDNEGKE